MLANSEAPCDLRNFSISSVTGGMNVVNKNGFGGRGCETDVTPAKKYFMLEYKSKHLPLIVSDKVKILNIFKAMSPLITARVQTVDLSLQD